MKRFFGKGLKAAVGAGLIFGAMAAAPSESAAIHVENAWNLDLSGVIAGLGNHTNIDRVTVDGSALVIQGFGSNGIFNNGDTFVEFSLLQTMTYWTEPGTPGNMHLFDLTDNANNTYNMYLYGTGLAGYVYDVQTPNPFDPTTWSFKYTFIPGAGSLGIYLDTDTTFGNGVTATLATFNIVAPSGGLGPQGFLGGANANGTSDITASFSTAMAGVWKTQYGLDFSTLPADFALGLLNSNNRVTAFVPTANGFMATVNSSGELNVVVPEPSTIALLGAGIFGLGFAARRLRKK